LQLHYPAELRRHAGQWQDSSRGDDLFRLRASRARRPRQPQLLLLGVRL